ncbi:probable serine/threonine-protein kinase kinX isoform X4 [Periplaneta americana]
MDVINMESEVSPLAVQSCDHVVKEEENTTVESTDSTYVFEWEMKIEENAVPITFPVIKFEPEEETFGMARVKQESQLEVATEESEILTDSTSNEEVKCTVAENRVPSENPVRESTAKNNVESQSDSYGRRYL